MCKLMKGTGLVISLLAVVAHAFASEGPSFLSKPLMAGRASLTVDGFAEVAS